MEEPGSKTACVHRAIAHNVTLPFLCHRQQPPCLSTGMCYLKYEAERLGMSSVCKDMFLGMGRSYQCKHSCKSQLCYYRFITDCLCVLLMWQMAVEEAASSLSREGGAAILLLL